MAKTAKSTKNTDKVNAKPTKTAKTAKSTKSKKSLKLLPVVRLAIDSVDSSSNSQFGPGIANLCIGVRELGSLNAAAKHMGMAYSKAWRIVKDTESALGLQLLIRDGAHGSDLTDEGNMLLDAYIKLNSKLEAYAAKEFEKLFKA